MDMTYISLVRDIISEQGRPLNAYVRSYGCQLNYTEGDRLKGLLTLMGFSLTDDQEAAELLIFNTCAVRENAEDRVLGNIGFAKHLKEQRPEVLIAVGGCMTQQQHIADKIKRSYPFVDIVFGTSQQSRLPELIWRRLTEKKRQCDITETDLLPPSEIPVIRNGFPKASVPIMYGCNNFCTYCVVPYVRGRERSRRPDEVISEVTELVSSGYKEILLLGQNVNSYDGGMSFPELLQELDRIDGDFIIRFMSSHPKDAGRTLIDTIAGGKHIAKQLHLPVQSGSNEILRRMNRRYTVESYLEIVDYARSLIPDFSLSSDIIVGFPDETEEHFQATLDLLTRVKYDNLFTFIYSKREKTAAAEFQDSVSAAEKSARMGRLLALQRELTTVRNKRFLGKTLRVLCEGRASSEGLLTGKSPEGTIVEFPSDADLTGQFVNVRITGSMNWAVCGELLP